MIHLLLAGLAFLFPIATYCLFLAVVNAREHPSLVSGPWDFLGVLFANSGFLLIGGPLLIAQVQTLWGEALAMGRVGGTADGWWLLGMLIWFVYFAGMIASALYFLKRRRACTVIYNIDPELLDESLQQAFAMLDLQAARSGNRIHLRSQQLAAVGVELAAEPGGLPGEACDLEIDPFPSLCNATLRWDAADSSLRRDVEAELGRHFRTVGIADNPAAGWFLTISTCLFGAIFLGLLAFIMLQLRR